MKNFKESLSYNEWTLDITLKQKRTLNRQAEMMKVFNKKLYLYLNKKLIKKSNYFSYSDNFFDKKLLDESNIEDLINSRFKIDHFYNEYVKNGNVHQNTDEEFYYDYGEYYYDQNMYENDYIDVDSEFVKIESQNSIKPQISRYKSQVLNVLNNSYLNENLLIRFIYFFHFVNFFKKILTSFKFDKI